MDKVKDWLGGKKTYLAAGLLVAVCAAEYFGVDVVPGIDKSNAVATGWEAVVAMCLRAGIAKS